MITVDRTQGIAGVDYATVTVTLRTTSGLPAVGVGVQLTATGTGNMFSQPALTSASGLTSAMYTSTVADAKTVSATVGGVTVAGPVITFAPGPVAKLGFGVQPTDVVAGAPFSPTVRVESQDAFGNFVDTGTGYANLTLSANPGSTFINGSSGLLLQNGFATFPSIHIDVAAAGYRLGAQSSSGLASGISTAFNVTPGVPDASHSSIAAVPHSLEANGIDTSQVTLHVGNAYGVSVAGTPVSVMLSGTNNLVAPTSGQTDNRGNFRATVSSTTAEVKTVTGTAGSAVVTGTVNFYGPSCRPMLPGGPMAVVNGYASTAHVADVDGDGKRDAIVGISQGVAVFRGLGDGTFAPEVDSMITPTGSVTSIASADFNGDGKLDLVLAVSNDSALTLMLGAGNGQFTAQAVPLPSYAGRVVVADFNLDSKPDVIVSLPSSSQVMVELGTGNGMFTAGWIVSADVADFAVLDANVDGKPDVVISASLALVTALGTGTGAFAAPTSLSAYSGKIVVGMFNSDAVPDVAVADQVGHLTSFLGSGTGTFSVSSSVQLRAGYVGHGGVVDLDGDGNQDIVLGGANVTTILKGTGAGAFNVHSRYYGSAETLAEMTGDAYLDLVVFTSHGVQVFAGTSTAAFVAPLEIFASGQTAERLFETVADFNGDGRGDYVQFRNTVTQGMNVLLTQPNNSVVQAPSAVDTNQIYEAVAGDFTGDGRQDVAIVRGAFSGVDLGIAEGNGTGALAALTTQNVTYPVAMNMVGADFDQDGKQDLLLYRLDYADIAVALSTGTGFTIQPALESPKARSVVVRDINQDGAPDVLVAGIYGFSSEIRVYLGTGTGALTPGAIYGTYPLTGQIAVGDLTNDGLPDLVFMDTSGTTQPTDRRDVFIYPNVGGGTFGAAIVTPNVRIPKILDGGRLHVFDITGDGNADIVLHSTFGTAVIGGFGDGYVRQTPLHYWVGFQGGTLMDPVVINDHDADAKLDLVYWEYGMFESRNVGCAP
ncbi:MAG: VCBS repeat-containing protein [Myxococcales bacterium]|nr:VCBS repeat-containing protein [Myxococcales bacterium]